VGATDTADLRAAQTRCMRRCSPSYAYQRFAPAFQRGCKIAGLLALNPHLTRNRKVTSVIALQQLTLACSPCTTAVERGEVR
jgi:hypothetical protein